MQWKANWLTYLKVIGIVLAITIWAVTTQAKWDQHMIEMRDSIKLLMLICKNTAPTHQDQVNCYEILDWR